MGPSWQRTRWFPGPDQGSRAHRRPVDFSRDHGPHGPTCHRAPVSFHVGAKDRSEIHPPPRHRTSCRTMRRTAHPRMLTDRPPGPVQQSKQQPGNAGAVSQPGPSSNKNLSSHQFPSCRQMPGILHQPRCHQRIYRHTSARASYCRRTDCRIDPAASPGDIRRSINEVP